MSDNVLTNKASITNIPQMDIQKYMLKHRCSPVEAFSDLLSERLLKKIEEGQYADVLTILVENVIGKGIKK